MNSKGVVIVKVGEGDLALVLEPKTARDLGNYLVRAAHQAEVERRVMYITHSKDETEGA
jgi:hypothetical protein